MTNQFVHLHVHSEFSLLDGINRLDTFPGFAKGMGQPAVALTDHGNVAGSYQFYKECKDQGIKPIIGMEAYYTVGDRTVFEKDDLEKPYYHVVLLALNNQGLHNLFKLSTYAYTEGKYYAPRIDDDLIGQYSEGIAATSACLGSRSSQLIMNGQRSTAEKLLQHHYELFGGRFLIELQLHDIEEQQLVNQVLIEQAAKNDWPLVLTNDCHYMHKEDKDDHGVITRLQTGDSGFQDNFNDIQVHMADHDWMDHRRQQYPIDIPYEAISNTLAVANMVDSDTYFEDRKNRYPKFQDGPPDIPSWIALERLCKAKLYEKMGGLPPQEYQDRIDHELKVIKKMGFYDYLLIVWQFVKGARDQDVIVGPGRGSAAGSLVAYALDITQVDPIQYGLVFERWLNYGRAATPKILDKDLIKRIEESTDGHQTQQDTCCHT